MTFPGWLNSTLAADACGSAGALSPEIRPVRPGKVIAGRATTVQVSEGDNLPIRQAARDSAGERTVLVVAGSPTSTRAVMGDVLATALVLAGFEAAIIDGRIRDSAEIAALGLATWCRGTSSVGATRKEPGSVGVPITCGGVLVNPGDAVIADDDGVVVWPAARIDEFLALAEERLHIDRERIRRLRAGNPIED